MRDRQATCAAKSLSLSLSLPPSLCKQLWPHFHHTRAGRHAGKVGSMHKNTYFIRVFRITLLSLLLLCSCLLQFPCLYSSQALTAHSLTHCLPSTQNLSAAQVVPSSMHNRVCQLSPPLHVFMVMLVELAVGEILILSCHLCLISHTPSSTACFALNFRFLIFSLSLPLSREVT